MSAAGSTSVSPRSLVLLVAAGALAVVVVVLVLVFGVARPPALDTIAGEPDPAPSGSVAWIDRDGEDPCLNVVAPDGTQTELVCDLDLGDPIGWDADGILVRSWDVWDEVVVLDAQTGDEVRRSTLGDPEDEIADRGTQVVARTRNGSLTVTIRGTGDVVWETGAPENYDVRSGVVSPDGAWVALVDSAGRLLVVPADGSDEPRVWADGVSTWDGLVWEGTEPPGEGS